MKNLILTSSLGAFALLVSACGDNTTETAADTDYGTTGAAAGTTTATTTASTGWPAGARIVEEGGVTYRVNPDNTRVAIQGGTWRIVTENGERYRVGPAGTRVRIDDGGLDIDFGVNRQGNLDLDVSTDASDDRQGD